MIYVASPYSHPDSWVQARRYILVREFVHDKMKQNFNIFSPICYGHQFTRDFRWDGSAETWKSFNDWALSNSSALWVLKIRGWEESKGVQAEIGWWEANRHTHVSYFDPPRFEGY